MLLRDRDSAGVGRRCAGGGSGAGDPPSRAGGTAGRLVVRGLWSSSRVAVILVGVLGRGSAFPPHLLTIEQSRSPSLPNWSMAVIDSLQGTPIAEEL